MAERRPGPPQRTHPPPAHNAPAAQHAAPPEHPSAPPPHPHPSIPQHVEGPPPFVAHYAFPGALEGDHVRVEIDIEANILLISEDALEAYRRHAPFHYIGGGFPRGTHVLGVPSTGRWHVIIDLGGRAGNVQHHVGITHHNPTT